MTESTPPATAAKKRAATSRNGGTDPFAMMSGMASMNGAAMEAFLRASETTLKGMGVLSEEMMNFADKRFRASVETGQCLAKCVTFAEAIELQSKFARSATEDYLAEAGKLLNMSVQVAKDGMAPIESQVKETLSTINN